MVGSGAGVGSSGVAVAAATVIRASAGATEWLPSAAPAGLETEGSDTGPASGEGTALSTTSTPTTGSLSTETSPTSDPGTATGGSGTSGPNSESSTGVADTTAATTDVSTTADTDSSAGTSSTTGEPGSSSTGDSDDPCDGAGDGSYCGATLGGFADHNSVYQCLGGMTADASPCAAGCENGKCKQVDQDPCASAQSGNGAYCGGTLMGGDAASLYNCQNGGTAGKQVCSAGCKVNPPGIADACNPEGDPCQGANSGDGTYCGASLPGGDANVLYTCKGKASAGTETCADGCMQNPPGVPDACNKQQNGGECCLDVPPGVLTQDYSACGQGGSHYGIDYGTAVGTPIYASAEGTVVSASPSRCASACAMDDAASKPASVAEDTKNFKGCDTTSSNNDKK